MAFFGLTALGPQNTFAGALKGVSTLGLFSDNDWRQAHAAAAGPDGACCGAYLTLQIAPVVNSAQ